MNWRRQLFALSLLWALASGATPSTEPVSLRQIGRPAAVVRGRRDMNFAIEYLPADEGWVLDVLSRSDAARRFVNNATRDALLVTIRIVLAPDKKSFLQLVGNWAENSAAVAIHGQQSIVVNLDALRTGPAQSLSAIMVHEFAHIYLGIRCLRPLPRWLNEGIAMNIAGEWDIEDSAAIITARLFGRLMTLRELERDFPVQADLQQLAYRESYSVVAFLARQTQTNSISGVVSEITGERGASQIGMYWDAIYRESVEARWRRSLRSVSNWALLAFSSGVVWGFVVLLAFVAWFIRKRRSRVLRAEWDEEERIYEALDEEERRIWGDNPEPDDEEDKDERRPPWYG